MIDDFLINILASVVYDKSKSFFNSRKKEIKFDKTKIKKAITNHQIEVLNWSNELLHGGMSPKNTVEHYINLKYYATSKGEQHISFSEKSVNIDFEKYFEKTNKNMIVLGQPGSGKTTTSKYIANKILSDDNFFGNRFQFPVVIRFSELRNFTKSQRDNSELAGWQNLERFNIDSTGQFEGIFQKLFTIFGLTGLSDLTEKDKPFLEDFIIDILKENKIFLILDAFDEYSFSDNKFLIEEIRKISLSTLNFGYLLTSRTIEFPFIIENATKFEICPLDDDQIKKFASSWLHDIEMANLFFDQLANSTYLDTARRPLTLSHLLTIFEKSDPKTIPRKPNTIYSKVVELLIQKWDEERNIHRPSHKITTSKYSRFEAESKKAFLCKLSFYLTKNYFGTTFTMQQLRVQYLDLCESFDLLKDESHVVIKQLESHTGLFMKSGLDKYEFAHKVIQEYFIAEYLKGLPSLSNKYIQLNKLPNEIAILVALATEANDYFENVVDLCINENFSLDFISTLVNRIFLENPDFSVSIQIAETILNLFSYAYNIELLTGEKDECYKQFSNLILNNPTFIKSFQLLESQYHLEQSVARNINYAAINGIETNIKLNDIIILINNDNSQKIFYSKLEYISDWTYCRPYCYFLKKIGQ